MFAIVLLVALAQSATVCTKFTVRKEASTLTAAEWQIYRTTYAKALTTKVGSVPLIQFAADMHNQLADQVLFHVDIRFTVLECLFISIDSIYIGGNSNSKKSILPMFSHGGIRPVFTIR